MPTITTALLEVSIDNALALRQLINNGINTDKLKYICPECGKSVKPHRSSEHGTGSNNPAHFEHVDRNAECSLSDKL